MHHSVDVARGHQPRGMGGGQIKKGVAHVPPGEGARTLWVFSELVTHKVPSEQTGGAYALFEVTTPRGTGSPPHVHHREDESFYVLKGEYEFLVEGSALRAGAGSLLYVPKGTMRAHKNIGEGVAKMLVTQTPGGLYERFFEEVGRPVEGEVGHRFFEEQPDVESTGATAAKYGIEIAPPIVEETQPATR